MPIDPRELANFRHHQQAMITADRSCNRCGYNLKGLRPEGVCPECGAPMQRSSGSDRLNDNLSNAPISYLRTLLLGLLLMVVGAVLGSLSLFIVPVLQYKAVGLLGGAVLWWIGVFIVTGKREKGPNAIPDAMLDSAKLQLANRILQASWVLAGLGWLALTQAGGAMGVIALALVLLMPLVGLIGFVPLSLQLSSFADWSGHSHLADLFRGTAWTIAACGVLIVITSALRMVMPATGGFLWMAVIASMAVLGIAQVVFMVSVLMLLGTVQWAIKNAHFAHDRDLRKLERLRNPDPERFCPKCDYSLAGLPLMSPCPECGWIDPEIRGSHLAAIGALRGRRK